MRVAKRHRLATAPAVVAPAGPAGAPNPSAALPFLGELPLARIAAHLDTTSLGRLRATARGGLISPDALMFVLRQRMTQRNTLPPEVVTTDWDVAAWLQHAHMAQETMAVPQEAREFEDIGGRLQAYEARCAPSQWKYQRLEDTYAMCRYDAAVAWRIQGMAVAETLQHRAASEAMLRSVDYSALFFPPFPHFETATRGLPVTYVRFSTGHDPYSARPEIPLETMFAHTPQLRCLELTPKQNGSAWVDYDADFPLRAFCCALLEALESPLAPELSRLTLDFSRTRGPLEHALAASLMRAAAARPALREIDIAWPKPSNAP